MKKITVIIFCLSIFFASFLPNKDTDFGWHYRCGKEFFKNQTICLKNNFSYYLPDYQSYNPHFFYDIILSNLYDNFGFNGLSVLYGIIITFCALLFLKIIESLYLSIASFYLVFFLSFNVFALGLRSQIFSYLFFLISLFLIKKSKNNHRFLFLYPLLIFI